MKRKKQPRTEEIGIRELKSRASEVVRAVKEERARYVITQRGKPAALIIPLDAAPPEKSTDEVWERLVKIGEELGKGRSLVEITSGMNEVAEGVKTTLAVKLLTDRHGIEMPITNEVHAVLYEGKSASDAADQLMTRPLREESNWRS